MATIKRLDKWTSVTVKKSETGKGFVVVMTSAHDSVILFLATEAADALCAKLGFALADSDPKLAALVERDPTQPADYADHVKGCACGAADCPESKPPSGKCGGCGCRMPSDGLCMDCYIAAR